MVHARQVWRASWQKGKILHGSHAHGMLEKDSVWFLA